MSEAPYWAQATAGQRSPKHHEFPHMRLHRDRQIMTGANVDDDDRMTSALEDPVGRVEREREMCMRRYGSVACSGP